MLPEPAALLANIREEARFNALLFCALAAVDAFDLKQSSRIEMRSLQAEKFLAKLRNAKRRHKRSLMTISRSFGPWPTIVRVSLTTSTVENGRAAATFRRPCLRAVRSCPR